MIGWIAINLTALAILVAFVAWQARPATEAVRLRNALLMKKGRPEDFTWIPPNFPGGFKIERRQPPNEFREIVAALGLETRPGAEWRTALALASHLAEHVGDKGAIRDDLITTYRAILEGRGYCADFVDVYLALAHTAGLVARQWAFSFDGFGGHGHTVVEIFDPQRARWLMIDVFRNFHPVDTTSGEPLGVLEFREALLGRRRTAEMRPNGPGRPGFAYEHKALEYYHRGLHEWYLWWGNAVVSYDAHPLVKAASKASRALAPVAAYVARVQPSIRIYVTEENAGQVRRMTTLHRTLLGAAGLFGALSVALVVQLLSGVPNG